MQGEVEGGGVEAQETTPDRTGKEEGEGTDQHKEGGGEGGRKTLLE